MISGSIIGFFIFVFITYTPGMLKRRGILLLRPAEALTGWVRTDTALLRVLTLPLRFWSKTSYPFLSSLAISGPVWTVP